MVRLLPVERKGKTVWVEDAPTACAEGHELLVPTYGACPTCGQPVRMWECRAEGCGADTLVDDEHVHDSWRA